MILAATNPDTAAISWTYAASVIGFFTSLAIFCATGVWLLDRAATRGLRRKIAGAHQALDNGDANVLRACRSRRANLPAQLGATPSGRNTSLTNAKLVTSPAEGHGLTNKLTDPLYSALANKRPTAPIVAVVVLKPVGLGQRETKNGSHQHVVFEATHLEPVTDLNQANELRYLVQALYEQRTSTGEQRTLPLGLGSDEEKRHALMERIEEWGAEQGLNGSELEAKWREWHGAGTDDEWSFGDQGVPGDYRKATVAHLLSFGYSVGALSTDAKLPHEEREDDEADTDASDEGEEADTVGVKCQVCNKKSKVLTDGLCNKCAKNAGVPVLDATDPEAETA